MTTPSISLPPGSGHAVAAHTYDDRGPIVSFGVDWQACVAFAVTAEDARAAKALAAAFQCAADDLAAKVLDVTA